MDVPLGRNDGGALAQAVHQGKAFLLSFPRITRSVDSGKRQECRKTEGVPATLIHQPSYSMLNRWVRRNC